MAEGTSVNYLLVAVSLAAVMMIATACPCPPGYVTNPHTRTCLRRINKLMSWHSAKAFCESSGEHLVVFDSMNSISWFEHLRRTNPAWANGWLWLGGKKDGGKWKWFGRLTNEFEVADWEDPQPDGNGECVQIFARNRKIKWDDFPCSGRNHFVCEK